MLSIAKPQRRRAWTRPRRRDSLPPCGGGLGWGVGRLWQLRAPLTDPHPQPLPTRGRGGVRGAIFMTKPRIAVIGAGLMGHGIAQVFGLAGHDVTITDAHAPTLASAKDRILANLTDLGDEVAGVDQGRDLHLTSTPTGTRSV